MRIFAEFTKKHLCWNLFFDKANFKIEYLKQVFSGEKFWNTFFAEHHRTTASGCSNININEGRTSKKNRKLLKRAVQAKEQVSEAVVHRLQIRFS